MIKKRFLNARGTEIDDATLKALAQREKLSKSGAMRRGITPDRQLDFLEIYQMNVLREVTASGLGLWRGRPLAKTPIHASANQYGYFTTSGDGCKLLGV